MQMRRGRQYYGKKYDAAIKLHGEGRSVREIAEQLDVSYSAAYHWVRGLRKPETGNLNDFEKFLEENGPTPVIDLEKRFLKHNELFLMSNKRGMRVKRRVLKRRYGKYATWYYTEGQENILEKRLNELFAKVTDVRKKLRNALYD